MKAALTAAVAFVFLIAGWAFLLALLRAVYYIASHAREGIGLIHLSYLLSEWILCPLYGGFLATYITPRIFKGISAAKTTTHFIAVVVTLAVSGSLLGFSAAEKYYASLGGFGMFIVAVLQVVTIIVGAKLGKRRFYDDFLANEETTKHENEYSV